MTSFLHVLAGKHIAVMVVLALIGLLSLSSSNPQTSGIAAAPLDTSVSTASRVQNSIKLRQTLQVGPTVILSPDSGNFGDTITVTLSAYPANSSVTDIKIGTKSVSLDSSTLPGGASFIYQGNPVIVVQHLEPRSRRLVDVGMQVAPLTLVGAGDNS